MELFQRREWQPNCYGLHLNKAVFHVDLDFFKVFIKEWTLTKATEIHFYSWIFNIHEYPNW